MPRLSRTVKAATRHEIVVIRQYTEWENAMQRWKRRYGVALRAVAEVGVEKMRGSLGQRKWEDVAMLRDIEAGAVEELEGEATASGGFSVGEVDAWCLGWVGRCWIDLGLRPLICLSSKIKHLRLRYLINCLLVSATGRSLVVDP